LFVVVDTVDNDLICFYRVHLYLEWEMEQRNVKFVNLFFFERLRLIVNCIFTLPGLIYVSFGFKAFRVIVQVCLSRS